MPKFMKPTVPHPNSHIPLVYIMFTISIPLVLHNPQVCVPTVPTVVPTVVL